MREYTHLNQYTNHQTRMGQLPPVFQNRETKTTPQREIRILVVEDEAPLRELLQISLQKSGYEVITARDGISALELFDTHAIDLVLLDVMIPELDGFKVCAKLREHSDVPVVMLSALNRPDDIVYGFKMGADDYICKPFTFREIEVRIQAILRRVSWNTERTESRVMAFNEITLNDELHQVKVRDKIVHLTPTEYQLLRHLMGVPDRPVSKNDLFQTVWGYDLAGGTNLVEVAVRRLREKIEDNPSEPVYLVTVRGAGYKFNTHHASSRTPVMA
ncbi:MAG: response regulator transcription factor [Caldilineaceae bacterium]